MTCKDERTKTIQNCMKTIKELQTQLDTEAKEFEEAERKIREISDLCSNCRNLSDAQAIADGLEGSSTDEGCCKCWVDQLQTQLEAEQKEKEWLEVLLKAYRKKRAVDGLNGRMWDAHEHLIANEEIDKIEQALKKGGVLKMLEALIKAEKECTEHVDIKPEKVLRPIGDVQRIWVEDITSTDLPHWVYYRVSEHMEVFRGRSGNALYYERCEALVGIDEIEYKQALAAK